MMTWRVPDSRRDEAARRLLQQVPHNATARCKSLQHIAQRNSKRDEAVRQLLQQVHHTATRCNILQSTATRCNSL